jgi:hypothetical protein
MLKFLSILILSLLLPSVSRAGDVQHVSTAKMLVGGLEVNPKLKNGEPIPESFYGTCVELLQTSSILNGARARVQALHPDLPSQPCKLEAGRLTGTRIIVLRTSAPEREYARAYLDCVMDEFLAKGREVHGRGAQAELDVVMRDVPRFERDIARAEQQIKAAEQNGMKPDQLVEPKAKLQQDKMFYERLLATVRKLEDLVHAGGGGEVFSVIERASAPVALQPGSSLPDLFKKQP